VYDVPTQIFNYSIATCYTAGQIGELCWKKNGVEEVDSCSGKHFQNKFPKTYKKHILAKLLKLEFLSFLLKFFCRSEIEAGQKYEIIFNKQFFYFDTFLF